jgi:hypothetical protein
MELEKKAVETRRTIEIEHLGSRLNNLYFIPNSNGGIGEKREEISKTDSDLWSTKRTVEQGNGALRVGTKTSHCDSHYINCSHPTGLFGSYEEGIDFFTLNLSKDNNLYLLRSNPLVEYKRPHWNTPSKVGFIEPRIVYAGDEIIVRVIDPKRSIGNGLNGRPLRESEHIFRIADVNPCNGNNW